MIAVLRHSVVQQPIACESIKINKCNGRLCVVALLGEAGEMHHGEKMLLCDGKVPQFSVVSSALSHIILYL